MTDPTQEPSGANPEAWGDDQPEDPAKEVPVVDLTNTGNDERKNGCSTWFTHLVKRRRYLLGRKPMFAICSAVARHVAILQ